MYTSFFKFSEEPFRADPDPKFLFPAGSHQEALDSMEKGIKDRKGFVLITGEPGIGKTLLIRHFLGTLEPGMKTVPIYESESLTLEELLEKILQAFDQPVTNRTREALVEQLDDSLAKLQNRQESPVILIDDAHRLSKDILADLALLCDWEGGESGFFMVLAGLPEFEGRLEAEELKPLKKRIVHRCLLRPFSAEECQDYIESRLQKVNSGIFQVFTPEAVSLICSHSRGVPKKVNILCDNAFLIGFGLQQKIVDAEVVKEVLEDLDMMMDEEPSGWPSDEEPSKPQSRIRGEKRPVSQKILYPLAALIGVGVVIFFGRMYWKTTTESPLPKPGMTQSLVQEGSIPSAPETKTESVPKAIGTPPGEPSLPAPEKAMNPPAPPPETSAQIPPGAEKPLPAPPPAKPAKEVSAKQTPPKAIAVEKPKRKEERAKRPEANIITVSRGNTIYKILKRSYGAANTTLVDYVLNSNPGLSNPDQVRVKQKIHIPPLTDDSLILKTDGSFQIWLGTFLQPGYAKYLKAEPALRGKEIQVIPRKIPSGETWYKVLAGKFKNREDCLKMIRTLRAKGLLPAFGGGPEKKKIA
jgi:general secretion pathway protein A